MHPAHYQGQLGRKKTTSIPLYSAATYRDFCETEISQNTTSELSDYRAVNLHQSAQSFLKNREKLSLVMPD